jgi:hypothetical protein
MQGAQLLYDETGCMAQNRADCYATTHPYYRFTQFGVDQAMKQLFLSVEGLLMAQPAEVNLHNPNLKYIWEVRCFATLSRGLIEGVCVGRGWGPWALAPVRRTAQCGG